MTYRLVKRNDKQLPEKNLKNVVTTCYFLKKLEI